LARREVRNCESSLIDEIIQPGVNLNPADTSHGEQALQTHLRRR
jgi:hypothetical protein